VLFDVLLQPMSGLPGVDAVSGREPSVDRSEMMMTTVRSGRVAIQQVKRSDGMSVPVAVSFDSLDIGTEHLQLTQSLSAGETGTAAATTSTTGDVSAGDVSVSEKVDEAWPSLLVSGSKYHESTDELDRRLSATGPLSADIGDRSPEGPYLEQLENVQVAIKVFLFFACLYWTCGCFYLDCVFACMEYYHGLCTGA